MKTAWPDHYPPECPPRDASPPRGRLYRYTNRKNPQPGDFKSYFELRPGHEWGDMTCQARGLSVFKELGHCKAMEAAIPALKKKHIATAILPDDAGVVAATPSKNSDEHYTFWAKLSAEELHREFQGVTPLGECE